jgi:thiol:disulfide interchange protein DsbD
MFLTLFFYRLHNLLLDLRCALVGVALLVVLTHNGHAQTQILSPRPVGQTFQTPQVKATLLAEAPNGIGAGKTLWLGLEMVHQPKWHTYWRNPGDSGLPIDLQWKLPEGLVAGNLIWPVPRRIPIGPLANFGYEDTLLLVTPIQVSKTFKPQGNETSVQIDLHANWLICKQECIPQEGDFSLRVPIKGATSMASSAFEQALQWQAQPLKGKHRAQISKDGRSLDLTLAQLPPELQNSDWTVFPQTANVIQNSAVPVVQKVSSTSSTGEMATGASVSLQVSNERMDSPRQMTWLLVQGKADAPSGRQWTVDTPVQGQWQVFSDPPPTYANLTPALQKLAPPILAPAPWATWVLAMLGALLGGVLLNLMPCVFPVLAIKLLNITQLADRPRDMKLSAWAFTAGVLISFLVLGALMLALRAAGSQMGWGFQLQSPWVVGALAMLFAVIGLNLSGMFEFGAFVPSSVAGFQWANPITNSLWSGVFAVVIASPCTAPFMGASLGLAIGLPAWQALPVFLAMGLGMALPFMAISFNTAWVRFLPRPGAWMQTFRQFMAFPMYATVVWLVWVLGQQVGLDGVSGFLACLLSLTLLIWALTLNGTVRRVMAALAMVVLAFSIWHWGPMWTQVTAPVASETQAGSLSNNQAQKPGQWDAWSAEKVNMALKKGQPVFVDFTAAWCVSCQFNKKVTFSNTSLLAEFASKNVLLLRADWTRYDPQITAALNELGRNGVPVYAWYAPEQPVRLLSELPSVSEIQGVLSQVKATPPN